MKSRSPNIVFITADQLGAKHLNCYGSGVPSTPALDAIAAKGTRFDRYYASSPVCTPNRAVMLTGRSSVVNGMIGNNFTLNSDTPTYAQVLKYHGYHTGGFGKFHQCPMPLPHPADFSHLGFDESVITEDPKWGAYTEWIRTHHPEHFDAALAVAWHEPKMHTPLPDERYENEYVQEVRREILDPLRTASPWDQVYTSPLPAECHQTTWITDLALDYMTRRREEDPDQPFMCVVSYVDPHDPYDPPKPYDTMFDPEDMPEPIPAAWKAEGNALFDEAQSWLGFKPFAENIETIKTLRAHYHGSIKFIDDQIARIAAYLEANDLWENTILVFSTDHGEALGDHQLICKGWIPYDAGIRCPLIVAGAGVSAQVSNQLTCTLDLFPTFCDWASIPQANRPPVEGKSVAETCDTGASSDTWDSVQIAIDAVESVVSADGWRLTIFDDRNSQNQLINLREDPQEQVNRYSDPSCADVRLRMFEQLAHHSMRVRSTQQYRNLPVVGDRKRMPGGPGNGGLGSPMPLYCDPADTPHFGAMK
ncbi:MAG: sulfatase-like hydrolase/transferase [Verrucomicrobia bacterium]|jgi:arylsulfatase|nr:sulfatase-like hydrolase/transferase [Verrucomicrobiota bacterium]MBT7066992.1 sulfatase-like hydrolase/transferase [Verrucomicrobiota bacterium]MBT7701890.1 sulfatase-like hydrolase/transferase [Verrucomicrobiota bacterium]